MSSSKIAVYTCFTAGYDVLPQPAVQDPDFDFIFFAPEGTVAGDTGVWQVRPLEFEGRTGQETSRWPKLNPHKVLQDYECSVWMDANVRIETAEFYELVKAARDSDTVYAGLRHPFRDCAYEEAYRVLCNDRDTFHNLRRTTKFLRVSDWPRHAGLFENNIIFRRHLDPSVVQADELWWQLYLSFSCRDQLTLPYCLNRYGVKPSELLPDGATARNHPSLSYSPHAAAKAQEKCWPLKKWHDAVRETRKLIFRTLYK